MIVACRTCRAATSGDAKVASELKRLAMMSLIRLRKGTRRRSAPSALCILAEDIIFMAPVIFSEEATEPMRPLSSRSVAIVFIVVLSLFGVG